MEKQKRGQVIISTKLLHDLLGLPDEVDVEMVLSTPEDIGMKQFKVVLSGDRLPVWQEGEMLMTVQLEHKKYCDIVWYK